MTRTRRPLDALAIAATDAAVEALRAAGVDASVSGPDQVTLSVDGIEVRIDVEAVAYCTGQRARDLVRRGGPHLVVADRITAEARMILSDASWSWLDRRGHLYVRAPGVRIDVDVPNDSNSPASVAGGSPIAGRGGLTVAYWLCSNRGDALSPTKSAAELRLAPSTISTAVRRLADAGFVERDGTGIFPELFWELAAAWQPEHTWLLAVPEPTSGWRRTGTAAAVVFGAPVVTAGGEALDLYVAGPVEISIAVRRYGAAQPGVGAATIAVAPVTAVVSGDLALPLIDGWRAAPQLAVALDLAQDRARGREILDEWDAPDAVWR